MKASEILVLRQSTILVNIPLFEQSIDSYRQVSLRWLQVDEDLTLSNRDMNKAKKKGTTRWSVTNPQQLVSNVSRASHTPVAGPAPGKPVTAKGALENSGGIDVRRMAEDAVIIREKKANTAKTTESKIIEPSGVFNKRTRGR